MQKGTTSMIRPFNLDFDRKIHWPVTPCFVECGSCGHWHAREFPAFDCRDDGYRYSTSDLEDHYGEFLKGVTLVELEADE